MKSNPSKKTDLLSFLFSTSVLVLCVLGLSGCGGGGNSGSSGSGGGSIQTYTLIYNGNGNTGGNVPASNNYNSGQTVTVAGNTGDLVNTTSPGYTFWGWTDGSGTVYTAGQTFKMPSANVTLYALWKTVSVIYNAAGGSGSVPVNSTNYQPGTTVIVPGNSGLTNGTETFVGWNTKSDGSGITYVENETFTMGYTGVTLYAQWAAFTSSGPVNIASSAGTASGALRDIRYSKSLLQQGGVKLAPLGRMPFATISSPASDRAIQNSTGPLVSTTAGLNFDGLSDSSQASVNGGYSSIPPDTNGAVGATQYVQWVNSAFQVFDKTTGASIAGPIAGSALWNGTGTPCATHNDGDGIVQYDKSANRWVIMQPVFESPYYLCVAVSTTSDATGTYYQYEFPIPDNSFPDYPKLAVWPDGYYVSYNQFVGSNASIYNGPAACVMDRANMLAGNTATMQCFNGQGNSNWPTDFYSLLPSDADGTTPPPSGEPDYYLSLDSSGHSLDLWTFHADFNNSANSSFNGPVRIPVSAFTLAICSSNYNTDCIPQAGTAIKIDSLGDRLMYRFAYRNLGSNGEAFVVNHSVFTSGTSSNVGVRWYELTIPSPAPASCSPGVTCGVPSLYQQSTFAPDSSYRWMGSIAMDKAGDIALGYSKSSSSMYPSIFYTGRTPADPLDTMESETPIIAGGGAQTSSYQRWGDYSGMSVDPVDDCTFWYTNEYFATTGDWNWQTRIASFKFPGCQ